LLDIFVANGHVYPGVDLQDWGTTWAERPLLLRIWMDPKFQEVPAATGSGLAVVVTARGAAFGDLIQRGHIGRGLNNIDSTPPLLGTWLRIRTLDRAKAVGRSQSRVMPLAPKYLSRQEGARQRGDVFSGGAMDRVPTNVCTSVSEQASRKQNYIPGINGFY